MLVVEANPVGQTANVVYDPSRTNVTELRRWIAECGYVAILFAITVVVITCPDAGVVVTLGSPSVWRSWRAPPRPKPVQCILATKTL